MSGFYKSQVAEVRGPAEHLVFEVVLAMNAISIEVAATTNIEDIMIDKRPRVIVVIAPVGHCRHDGATKDLLEGFSDHTTATVHSRGALSP